MRIATVDLISNTCFPLLAADELGLFKADGLDVSIELLPTGVQALRSGDVDLLADGAVYRIPREFSGWKGAKLVVALAQGTPWLRAVRAIVKAQRMLRADPFLAQKIGQGRFPPDSAELIVRTIQRDVGFYEPVITNEAVVSMNAFAQAIGYLPGPVPYEQVVDRRVRQCWTET